MDWLRKPEHSEAREWEFFGRAAGTFRQTGSEVYTILLTLSKRLDKQVSLPYDIYMKRALRQAVWLSLIAASKFYALEPSLVGVAVLF